MSRGPWGQGSSFGSVPKTSGQILKQSLRPCRFHLSPKQDGFIAAPSLYLSFWNDL